MTIMTDIKDLATIVAGLVREGVRFEVRQAQVGGDYIIELTGGY